MEIAKHPKSEIGSRTKRLQERMSGLHGILILQNTDMCYFSGTAQDGLLFIPAVGEPALLVRKVLERAKEESPVADVRPLGSFKDLKTQLKIPSNAVLGLELDVMPYNNYHRLAQALPGCQLTDASEHIKHVRAVKSRFEIGLIEQAASIIDAGISSAKGYIEPGMKDIELAANVERSMRLLGHQGVMRFRRWNHELYFGHIMSGPEATIPSYVASPTGGRGVSVSVPQGAGYRSIGRDEPVLLDYVGVYNGYCADETRIFCIGHLSKDLEQAHDAALEVQKDIARMLTPGASAKAVFEASEKKGEEFGYKDNLGGPPGKKCGFVGHGVGMEIDEYPVLAPTDQKIEAGNVIAVEPKMIFPGRGVVGIEDTFLVTESGAKRLTKLDQGIWYV